MLKRNVITGVLLCLLGAPLNLPAKDLIVISFTAEVFNVLLPDNTVEIARPGDEVRGTLYYDPDLPEIIETSERSRFDLLNSGSGGFEVEVNGHRFYQTINQTNNDGANYYSLIRLESRSRSRKGRELYANSIGAWCLGDGLPAYFEAEQFNMGLTLTQPDYETPLNHHSLPTHLDLADFHDAYFKLRIDQAGKGDNYIEAKLTSLTVASSEFNIVRGRVYLDRGRDCQFNDDDSPLARRLLRFTPGGRMAATDRSGEYSLLLTAGDYLVEDITDDIWEPTCPEQNGSLTVKSGEVAPRFNLGLNPLMYEERAQVSMVSSRPRPGFNIEYVIKVNNSGTLPFNGKLRFNFDPILVDFNSAPTADELTQAEAVWQLNNMPVGDENIYRITLRVPPDEMLLGRQLCAWAQIDKVNKPGDDLLGGSADEICQEIRGSYDPNDIRVFVDSRDAAGEILPEDRVLNYVIRFQNEGTAEAVTVRVIDELSEFLNIGKLRIGACSHDFEFNFTENNALEWTFNNINLPPKSEDEAASQGYIKFHIELNDDLPPGTEIANQAAIYFDFNTAVLTNTVVSRIADASTGVDPMGSKPTMSLYPNPATDIITIEMRTQGRTQLTLRNSLGQPVLSAAFRGERHTLDLRSLAAGAYYLTLSNENGTNVSPLSIVR